MALIFNLPWIIVALRPFSFIYSITIIFKIIKKRYIGIRNCVEEVIVNSLFSLMCMLISLGIIEGVNIKVLDIYIAEYNVLCVATIGYWVIIIFSIVYFILKRSTMFDIEPIYKKYIGEPIIIRESEINIRSSEGRLIPFSEYEIINDSYENNNALGIASCELHLKGFYSGKQKVIFEIRGE